MRRRDFLKSIGFGAAALTTSSQEIVPAAAGDHPQKRPNILWICAEDMSANMSCYGETTIQTPNIDRLAAEGSLFKHAFITAPVCSPSRSAMVTGMYQTTIGAHLHRSSRHAVKIRLPEHIKLISEYFQQAGYYTSNGSMLNKSSPGKTKPGKTDYNFVWDQKVYDGPEWSGRKPGQPFFAQIQLRGGKNRGANVPDPVAPANVKLPPYYPDHPVLREDWARYLNSVVQTDIELGEILKRLQDEGIAESTVVFFWTDHGISHIRGKQYLYEEGIHIPLIVRGPGIKGGTVREDLVEHIDIAATSLSLAGVPIPSHIQGRALFARDYKAKAYIFSARDRCDETVERMRCVRTSRYKYIRNFYPHRPHTQPNRYKDGKQIMVTMRGLFAAGKLNSHQARPFLASRPVEELYNLQSDPHELHNLGDQPEHQRTLKKLRARLTEWMDRTGDLGQIPEPILAELLRQYDSPYAILQDKANQKLARRINEVRQLAEQGAEATQPLIKAMKDKKAPVRYVAAMGLGNMGAQARPAAEALSVALKDKADYVRVAAARALCLMDNMTDAALAVLERELTHSDNEVVRHYAALALEEAGEKARPAIEALKKVRNENYEYVKRVATRIVNTLERGQ
ncbi:MAG: sulfatase-like hydrolase/transferase [Planctomycetes bacterium]|nr:sulfatase-like hydrolase/transferase [Planctomycetota bacterium]